jgi:hypothetical protein
MSVFLVLFFVLTYSQWYLSFEFPRPGSKRLLCLDHVKRFTRLRLHELLIAFSGILFVVSSVTPDEATLDLLLFFCVSSNSQAQSYISATTINLSVFALFVLIGETSNVYSEAISGEKVSLERSRYYFLIVGLVMCAFSQAAVEFYRRHRFAVSLLFSTEVGRNQELLYRMLPSAVVAQLLTGGGEHAAHEFSGVCILVCDVVSFTKLSSESSPVEVIAMLNGMFAGFERAAAKYKVFKVQTIGDAFVCVAGIPYVDGDADIVKQLEPGKVDPTVDSGTKKNDTLIMDLRTPQKSSNTNSIVSPVTVTNLPSFSDFLIRIFEFPFIIFGLAVFVILAVWYPISNFRNRRNFLYICLVFLFLIGVLSGLDTEFPNVYKVPTFAPMYLVVIIFLLGLSISIFSAVPSISIVTFSKFRDLPLIPKERK